MLRINIYPRAMRGKIQKNINTRYGVMYMSVAGCRNSITPCYDPLLPKWAVVLRPLASN